ncbi:type VI secretion system baseplate subunit TssF [Piscinibacter sp. HJYY11]|uniref:type VI secretion system baseplate subunit TssF n=1 Tax=Piscinibacter sp. HJYY11 TaxID=2801333 RepID=UPI00191D19BB|nr:type VI secretion system baseplate subunit TssF [Piscinibacter sp. HJYY11]MBL0730552.1 type VI secretion system baseplate subunit TssF [Piscinibacter sp. HJYY11]
MDKLLPHYERELAFLRGEAKEFSQRYPKVAGRLLIANGVAEDPHVERLIQSFALLSARVQKRLDDDFPLVTESLLEVLYPHYLRPFPSCSIAQFDAGDAVGQMSGMTTIPRGTLLSSRPVRGVACKFRTVFDVQLGPCTVAGAGYRHAVAAPQGTRLVPQATSVVSIRLELHSGQMNWSDLPKRLRVYLDGETSQTSALREALCNRVVGLLIQDTPHGPWVGPFPSRPEMAGFDDDEALIDYDERSHPAYRLLTEYFAFPAKFDFVDLQLPPHVFAAMSRSAQSEQAAGPRTITLHYLLSGFRSDSDEARLLETISARNFGLGCTPVVNLFRQNADPIRVTHAAAQYPVVVDARRAFGYEVHSIDKVFRVKQTPQGEAVEEFRPFFSLHHGDMLGAGGGAGLGQGERRPVRYWHVQRDDAVAASSPGYELEMSIVDADFEPALPQTDTLSIQVTATNRDLPSQLGFGAVGGDLFIEGGTVARAIRMLRKPTATHSFERGRGSLWRLVSHLSLNHLSLSGRGIEALREMLRLYDLPQDATNRRQIEGLVSVDFLPATAWLAGEPFATFVRGTEVRIVVDEESYVGTGLGLFVAVLDRFFGLYVHINSFTQLTVVSSRTQQTLFKCPPRNGSTALV